MFTSHDHHQMLPYSPRPLPVIDTGDRWKPIVELAPNCPRCDSSNTKFCYYNNYSLTQPRYFCKGCRRYWTKGGSLRNIPVGGGCRKNRRGKSIRPSRHPVEPNYSNSLRPDLALDGMVGRSTSLTGSGSEGSSIDTSGVASDGSTIDLAALYSKFLNHRPPSDSGIIVPELIDVDPFELMCSWVPIQQPEPSQGPPVTLDELDYSDQMSYGSLGFSEGVSTDVFVSNSSISPEIQEFHPIPTTDNMGQQHQDLVLGDWSTFLQSNFEQF